MNIYSLNIIKKNYLLDDVQYTASLNLHTESFTCAYTNPDVPSDCGKIFFSENGVLFQSFMTLLDMNDPNATSSTEAFQKLEQLKEILCMNNVRSPEYLSFLESLDRSKYADTATECLDLLKEIIESRSALCYLYPMFYRIMTVLYRYIEEDLSKEDAEKEIASHGEILSKELDCIENQYISAQEYVKRVFYLPYRNGIKRPAYQIAFAYQSYCLRHGHDNFVSHTLKDDDTEKISDDAWITCMKDNLPEDWEGQTHSFPVPSMQDFLQSGIELMLQSDMTLRKCQNCGGYFCVKYTSNQEYCNRSYSNASTCSEYAARKSYKDRLFENPINTEYTKAYNRLYARIRRKKLPADTPLKDELLKLRNEYMERYEHTHKKNREIVWKEYIQKNKELLG